MIPLASVKPQSLKVTLPPVPHKAASSPTRTTRATGTITGAGTTGTIPKFTGANAIGNSVLVEKDGKIGLGLGTTSPPGTLSVVASTTSYSLYGANSGVNGSGVYGLHSSKAGDTAGVTGETASASASAAGVRGTAKAASGGATSAGVRGLNLSTNDKGFGVYGSHSGTGVGVYGTAAKGIGVRGSHTDTTGTVPGVLGETNSTDNYAVGVRGMVSSSNSGQFSSGVAGFNNGTGDNGEGVYGYHAGSGKGVYGFSSKGNGVLGQSTSNSGVSGISTSGSGVYAISQTGAGVYSTSSTGVGVFSHSSTADAVYATSDKGNGVYASSDTKAGIHASSNSGTGIYAISKSGNAISSYSESKTALDGNSDNGYGVYGRSTAGVGIRADSNAGDGVYATTTRGTGVVGASFSGSGVVGNSTNQFGVHAISPNGTALFAESSNGVAGSFLGKVVVSGNLQVTGTLSKGAGSFKIDHPLHPATEYLSHSFVESPDMMNVYNGNTTTNAKGEAWVTMPTYFQALNRDFRYQLTPIGQFAQAIIGKEIVGNRFQIKTDKPNIKVSWQVTGIRNDAYARQHRIQVEENKLGDDRGKYLYPAGFGAGDDKSIGPSAPRLAAR